MKRKLNIAFFGSSLLSAYWNGAATYYRGIIRALHDLGHEVTFYEPDAFNRKLHRDIEDPDYARSVVYSAQDEKEVAAIVHEAEGADIAVKASGVGVYDEFLEKEILTLHNSDTMVVFWDVDAPATLDRVRKNPDEQFRFLIPQYDMILTYGGGEPVVSSYKELGAEECFPIYNALDPLTHFPVPPDERFRADLGFLGNRMPDREERVWEYFFKPVHLLPEKKFIIGGSGWHEHIPQEKNLFNMGHIYTKDHNAFNSTPLASLNISRESMARYGYSPATRVFEAAGAGACIITDAWKGIELFLKPGEECLVARSGNEVADILAGLTSDMAKKIGAAAYQRIINEHTYAKRAEELEDILLSSPKLKKEAAV
ncbi:MAG TPA: glycosyltransferase [Ignavibacteriales bacterium]|nr:glycosyltransferase [Ignavibacteriales bacterium]